MIRHIFGKKNSGASEPAATAIELPVTRTPTRTVDEGVPYKADLIDSLKSEHREIGRLFMEFRAFDRKSDVPSALARLRQFKDLLRGHLLKENLYLYVYLRSKLKSDEESIALIAGMRSEMSSIGKAIATFIDDYVSASSNPQKRQVVQIRIEEIKEALVQRVSTEEQSLYPLYLPPGAYAELQD